MTGRTYLEALIWWCGDEVCDCHQPQINLVKPNPLAPGFVTREAVWRGRFEGEGDTEGMLEELRAAAAERGIALDEDGYGTKDA